MQRGGYRRGWQQCCRGVLGLIFGLMVGPVSALSIGGQVVDEAGKPLAGVMVTAESSSAAAFATTVFSADDGRYQLPDLGSNVSVNSVRIGARRLGHRQVTPAAAELVDITPETANPMGPFQVDFVLQPQANVADQVAPALWTNSVPESEGKYRTLMQCVTCHAVPNERVKRFAASLDGKPLAVREQAWRGIVAYMRVQLYGALQAEHSHVENIPEAVRRAGANELISPEDEDYIAGWLAEHMPTRFDNLQLSETELHPAPLGANANTVIEEFAWPAGSFSREVAKVPGSPYVWAVDLERNRLMRLDPSNGALAWFDLPVRGASAPHTLVPGPDNKLWIACLAGDGTGVVIFDPQTETWETHKGFGAQAMSHDFSIDPNYRVSFDDKGRTWLTQVAVNRLASFNPVSGEIATFDLPLMERETPAHAAVYGLVKTSDNNVWYTQVAGSQMGRFNTTTLAVDHLIEFPLSVGPRRLAVDENDILYVPLFSAGQLYIFDAKAMKHLATVDLPDRSAAPYNVSWDSTRKVLWVGTTNADKLYRFDPKDRSFTEFPLPRRDAHLRMMSVDHETGDLWMSYAPIPISGDKSMIARLHPGDR